MNSLLDAIITPVVSNNNKKAKVPDSDPTKPRDAPNRIPFVNETGVDGYITYPEILQGIAEEQLTVDDFRTSRELISVLSRLIDLVVLPSLSRALIRQSMKTRLDSLMKMAVSILCFPRITSVLGFNMKFFSEDSNSSKLPILKDNLFFILCFFRNSEDMIYECGE